MTVEKCERLYWKFYDRYRYFPTRIWVDSDTYRSMHNSVSPRSGLLLSAGKWSLVFFNTVVEPR